MKISKIFTDCGYFKNHSLLFTLFLLITFNKLFCDFKNINQTDIVNVVSDSLLNSLIEAKVDQNSRIVILFQGDLHNDLIKLRIFRNIIENNYQLVENLNNSDYIVSLNIYEELYQKKSRSLISNRKSNIRTNFFLKITETKSSEILLIKEFTHQTPFSNTDEGKWFTPFLITFVIGSLVYLLYYSNN